MNRRKQHQQKRIEILGWRWGAGDDGPAVVIQNRKNIDGLAGIFGHVMVFDVTNVHRPKLMTPYGSKRHEFLGFRSGRWLREIIQLTIERHNAPARCWTDGNSQLFQRRVHAKCAQPRILLECANLIHYRKGGFAWRCARVGLISQSRYALLNPAPQRRMDRLARYAQILGDPFDLPPLHVEMNDSQSPLLSIRLLARAWVAPLDADGKGRTPHDARHRPVADGATKLHRTEGSQLGVRQRRVFCFAG